MGYLAKVASSEHVTALMSDMGHWRIRCEEVAAAAANAKVGQSFSAIDTDSVAILAQGQNYLATKRAVMAATEAARALAQ